MWYAKVHCPFWNKHPYIFTHLSSSSSSPIVSRKYEKAPMKLLHSKERGRERKYHVAAQKKVLSSNWHLVLKRWGPIEWIIILFYNKCRVLNSKESKYSKVYKPLEVLHHCTSLPKWNAYFYHIFYWIYWLREDININSIWKLIEYAWKKRLTKCINNYGVVT
jgi:hypothetical protein